MNLKNTFLSFILITLLFVPSLAAETGDIDGKISSLSEKLAAAYKQKKEINFRKRIAIAEFENISENAKKNNIGEAVGELLGTEFSRSTIFVLVERKNLEKVLKEQELQLTGMTESDSVVKVGQLMNADAILSRNWGTSSM
ncbi:MAG: CsgG/HfaB family protein [bacterium]|nr:CsgG/HfaB family protein [bacterium]